MPLRHVVMAIFVVLLAATTPGGDTRTAHAQSEPPHIEVDRTAFRIIQVGKPDLVGPKVVGAVLGFRFDGQPVRVRIAAVMTDPRNPDVLLHDFRHADTGEPLCAPDAEGNALGFPLRGHSLTSGVFVDGDASQFELVCTSGAQGKCTRLGYFPWDKSGNRTTIDLFNACLRMIRADYCGDGRSWTRDGTLIDIWDGLGIQKPEKADDHAFSLEAAWTADGAWCVAHTRIPEKTTLEALLTTCPHLPPASTCTESRARAAGVLLFNGSR